MALEIYPGPGTTSYNSSRFTVTVNGSSLQTYGVSRTSTLQAAPWTVGDTVEMSWASYGSDAEQTVEITRLAGAITTCEIWPKNLEVAYTISGNRATLTVPVRSKLYIELNGDKVNPIMVFANQLKTPANDGVHPIVTYVAQTSAISGSTLYFGPGVYTIGQMFPVPAGSRVYLDAGAWVIGSFDIRHGDNVTIEGPGVLSGSFADHAAVNWSALTWLQKTTYSMVNSYTEPTDWVENCAVRDITIVNFPFYGILYVNTCRDVKMISPWCQNTDGFTMAPDYAHGGTSRVDYCFSYVGDDNYKNLDNRGDLIAEDNFLINSAASPILLGYQQIWVSGGTTTLNRNTVLSRAWNSGTTFVQNYSPSVIKLWRDEYVASAASERHHIYISDLWVEGGEVPLFSLECHLYPWGSPRAARGKIVDFTLSNVTYLGSPARKSRLMGYDTENTPHGCSFSNITINGAPVNKSNWSSWVEMNSFPYDILVNGVALVVAAGQSFTSAAQLRSLAMSQLDAVNTILSGIGAAPVNSLAGVVSADVALARQMLEEAKLDVLLQGWTFNTEYQWVLSPRPDGRIAVPPAALRVDLSDYYDRNTDPVQRGQWLYNRKTRSYTWNTSITCDLILDLEWDELPQVCRRYVAALATRKALGRMDGDQVAIRMAQMDELSALANMRQYQVDTADATIFDAATSHWILNRGL